MLDFKRRRCLDESGSPSPTFRRGGGEVLGGGWVGWGDKKEEKKGKLRQRKRRKTCSPENVIYQFVAT